MTNETNVPEQSEGFKRKTSPYSDPLWLINLFFNRKFSLHRFFGLVFLIQYAASWYYYITNYEWYHQSFLVWTMPLNGVIQSVTATYYFSFLPKKVDPGYYSDKGALSFQFVAENIFFAALLAFAFAYNSSHLYPVLKTKPYTIIEHFFVFLPYLARPFFPKTSFRDAIYSTKNKSASNHGFFYYGTWITKLFYVWAKWYIGFFLNYLRYADRMNTDHQHEMLRMLLLSSFATNISMFLHTLKFKGYIGPKTSFGLYILSYLSTFYSIACMWDLFVTNHVLVAITAVGVVLNFAPVWMGQLWQFATMALLLGVRTGRLDIPI